MARAHSVLPFIGSPGKHLPTIVATSNDARRNGAPGKRKPHAAGVPECSCAITVKVLGEPDAWTGTLEQRAQRRPPHMPLVMPQILAVDLQQIERIQECIARAQAPDRSTQPIKIRHAVVTTDHALAVDRHRLELERSQGFRDPGHSIGPGVTTSREHAHALAIAPAR